MIGHRVRRALEKKARQKTSGRKPARKFTPKWMLYDIARGTRSSVTRCGRCGAIRQAGDDGKLPPHKCAA
jgi:hypothetical protein